MKKNIDKLINETINKLLLEYTEINEFNYEFINYLVKVSLYMYRNKLTEYFIPKDMLQFFHIDKYNVKTFKIEMGCDETCYGLLNYGDMQNPILFLDTYNFDNDNIDETKLTIVHEITHFLDTFKGLIIEYEGLDKSSFILNKKWGYYILYFYDPTEINARLNEAYYMIFGNLNYYYQNKNLVFGIFYKRTKIYYMKKLLKIVEDDKYIWHFFSKSFHRPYSIIYYLNNSETYFTFNDKIISNQYEYNLFKNNLINFMENSLKKLYDEIDILTKQLFHK